VLSRAVASLRHVGISFADWDVIATQHVQGSFVPLVEAFLELGMAAGSCTVLAKGYSSHPDAVRSVRALGVAVEVRSGFDVCQSYERTLETDILAAIAARTHWGRPLLLIDEGGRLVRAMERVGVRRGRVGAVEQTTRGIVLNRARALHMPVVSVATSGPKRVIESEWIVDSMLQGLQKSLSRAGIDSYGARYSVLGLGTIGSRLYDRLRGHGRSVSAFDAKPRNLGRFAGDASESSGVAHVILSSTGTQSLSLVDLERMTGEVVLVNCGSSDIEFPAAIIRCRAANSDQENGSLDAWHLSYRYDIPRGRLLLLNGGFPINFQGQMDSVPLDKFTLVRTLMLLGAAQAVTEKRVGLLPLSRDIGGRLWW
jgi:S-adenosylhomocysteine hydrolase